MIIRKVGIKFLNIIRNESLVEPERINDDQAQSLARDICSRIEKENEQLKLFG